MSIYSLIADANKIINESMSTYNPAGLEKKDEAYDRSFDMTKFSVDELNKIMKDAGYSDMKIIKSQFVKRTNSGQFRYDVFFADHEDKADVYVFINNRGKIDFDFGG
ncbi:hypothetical protein AU106_gp063 [Sinorhizobium phage phiM9]|uniref:Uncharacterized protein n=1 Tax=Sinorhizobium phage phiM9 TaxID=1636182 RepID=A0A0F6THG8_9CAUD|nr:hypothetical protein AU106_gp063 [Sinorhizobium phage phiM9]AKE44694.1 hypothetical protein Sm_phiM9_064 [Sinorhizobium phage phiM9]